MSRRVVHMIESGGLYGAEQVILALSREMKRSGEFQPIVACLIARDEEAVELADVAKSFDLEVAYIRFRKLFWFVDIFSMSRKLASLNVDLIHSHGYKPSVFGFLAAKMIGIPIMATCHLWFIDSSTPFTMRVLVKLELLLYRYFAKVISVSQEIAQILQTAGVPDASIRLIPNGIVLEDFSTTSLKNDSRDQVVSEKSSPTTRIVNIGRLTPQKAQWSIVEAIYELRQRGYDVSCRIVGEGELRQELLSLIEERGLSDWIELTGFQKDITGILKSSDVFLLPSLSEGMPIAMLEAIACKLPIVASKVGDIGKLVRNEESGLVIKSADANSTVAAISRIIDEPSLGQRLAQEALRELRKTYSSRAMYDSYRQEYERVFLGAKL